jgi:hypothetical protein
MAAKGLLGGVVGGLGLSTGSTGESISQIAVSAFDLLAMDVNYSVSLQGDHQQIGSGFIDKPTGISPTELSITTMDDQAGTIKRWFDGKQAQVAHIDGTMGLPAEYLVTIEVVHAVASEQVANSLRAYSYTKRYRANSRSIDLSRRDQGLAEVQLNFTQFDNFMGGLTMASFKHDEAGFLLGELVKSGSEQGRIQRAQAADLRAIRADIRKLAGGGGLRANGGSGSILKNKSSTATQREAEKSTAQAVEKGTRKAMEAIERSSKSAPRAKAEAPRPRKRPRPPSSAPRACRPSSRPRPRRRRPSETARAALQRAAARMTQKTAAQACAKAAACLNAWKVWPALAAMQTSYATLARDDLRDHRQLDPDAQ